MKIRWVLDMAFVGNVCVGRVAQLSAQSSSGHGQVQKEAAWRAWGMDKDWCDTDLGSGHDGWQTARRAVEAWYGSR